METNKYQTFTFCSEDYKKDAGEYGGQAVDTYAMYSDAAAFLRLAIQNGYQCRFWWDGYTLCCEYNYQDESLSGVSLEWIGENEYVETYAPAEANDPRDIADAVDDTCGTTHT